MANNGQTLKTEGLPDTGYVRISQLVKVIPFAPSTIWRKVKKGEFPKPVKLSANISGFKVEDIRGWMEAQNAQQEAA